MDLEWLAAVWDPVERDGNRILKVGRDRAHNLGRDGARTQGVGRDGTHGLEIGRDGARGFEIERDLLIRLQPFKKVNVDANYLALDIPNIKI